MVSLLDLLNGNKSRACDQVSWHTINRKSEEPEPIAHLEPGGDVGSEHLKVLVTAIKVVREWLSCLAPQSAAILSCEITEIGERVGVGQVKKSRACKWLGWVGGRGGRSCRRWG